MLAVALTFQPCGTIRCVGDWKQLAQLFDSLHHVGVFAGLHCGLLFRRLLRPLSCNQGRGC
jgi:hypothetical protein